MVHEDFMRKCIKLAQKARGLTSPNPMVGCVIVKNGKILARGFHRRAGLPHAEIVALNKSGDRARGATLYVNLEPCSHYGRTPPCTKAIIEAGIKKVYAAMLDPNPLNNGKGIEELRKNGIKVEVGILEEKAKRLNEAFAKFITKKIPFVTVKVAQSLDGKIATKTGKSKWISSENSRDYGKKLRFYTDAILVGVNTIIKDNPILNSKLFYKIILDSKLRTPINARIFSKGSIGKIILATTKYAPKKKNDFFSKKAEVLICKDKNSKVDLKDLMRKLAQREITHILIEGGGETIASALEAKVVDRILFFIAPKIIGGKEAITSVEGKGRDRLTEAIKFKEIRLKTIGEDLLISGSPVYQ